MALPVILRPVRRLLRPVAERWPWPVAVRLRDGRVMYVDLRSAIGRGILATGEFDPGVFVPFRGMLRAGHTFLDVGANVGYYSMLASAIVGGAGAVHAFEIDPRPLRCLRRIADDLLDRLAALAGFPFRPLLRLTLRALGGFNGFPFRPLLLARRARFRDGFAVCGGRYRDRPGEPPDAGNQSYAVEPAGDVGFRCVSHVRVE